VGFLSLSQEILWVRYVGFAHHSVPQAFSFVLTMFLLGIAAGAFLGKLLCSRTARLYTAAGIVLMAAGAVDMVGPLLAGATASHPLAILVQGGLILLCAALKGVVFPVAHHLGAVNVEGKVGRSVSRVYFFNVVGSTLGPLITGFILLDYLSLQHAMLVMGWVTVLVGVVCLSREPRPVIALSGAIALLALMGLFLRKDDLTAQLAFRYPDAPVRRVIENKSGVVHTLAFNKGGDFIFGGNVYDGRSNIDPRVNSNGLERVFVLAALRPEPKNVLIIGLSAGAWARILTGFPGVERIDAVEINPGYLDVIRDNPQISPLLSDPRFRLDIDDGRRWLKRHPDQRYDLMVMNTTYHWRAYSTNLLSREYLALIRAHLKPGGLITYNTTGSPDVLRTAEEVFPFAFRYANFVVASDQDFRPRVEYGEAQLYRITLDGRPMFDPLAIEDRAFIRHTLLEQPFFSSMQDRTRIGRDAQVITDWNMITEYRYGRKFP
jgi:spermidine synthase